MTRRSKHRIERDTLGEVRVPPGALWGAQTQRAVENFPVSGLRSHSALVRAFVMIKRAAATVNARLGVLEPAIAHQIEAACDAILDDRHTGISSRYADQFVVDVFQAGAGTSLNMNCNEVIATLASRHGASEAKVHPNDHVNMSQSTNDTFPTATRIAILSILPNLATAADALCASLSRKATEMRDVIKPGRTHLQDAMPVTLGQEIAAWRSALVRADTLLQSSSHELQDLPIGGTATGTGINAPPAYARAMCKELSHLTGLRLRSMRDLREGLQSQLASAAVSGSLRNLAIELGRVASDIRLLASGPFAGLGELQLPAVQPGSSIMPGKVNPSIPECMNQVCFHVIGADAAVAAAAQAGQLELNVMMPVIAFEILFSIEILASFIPVFTTRCIDGLEADRDRCREAALRSPALATLLNPIIGYDAAAVVAKDAVRMGKTIPDLVRERGLLSESEIERVFSTDVLTGRVTRGRKGWRP